VVALCNRDEQRRATKWLPGQYNTQFPERKSCGQVCWKIVFSDIFIETKLNNNYSNNNNNNSVMMHDLSQVKKFLDL
jgi:hypothetical protein